MKESALAQSPYLRGQDEAPDRYRTRCFSLFSNEFRDEIGQVFRALEAETFFFEEMTTAHLKQLRAGLLIRQSLPYYATWSMTSPHRRPDTRALEACLLAHTLALTHLDYHLDGAVPAASDSATAAPMPPETSVSYAVRLVYRSAARIAKLPYGDRILSEVLDPVSGFVMERMHQDWAERYSSFRPEDSSESIREYLGGSQSRLLASGYWEVMMDAAWIAAHPDKEIPGELHKFAVHLRRLRQLVDELQDSDEDLRSGVLTLPVLLRIEENRHFGLAVQHWWSRGMLDDTPPNPVSAAVLERMRELISQELLSASALARHFNSPHLAALVSIKEAKAELVVAYRSRQLAGQELTRA